MQITDNQKLIELQAEVELLWCGEIQALSSLRRTKMTQSQMAAITGKELTQNK